jgi:lipopolysaccharide transport system permease protein
MVVFTLVFGKLAKLPSEGVPYPILVFVALLPWQFLSNSFGEASSSLVVNANLLTKIYFPRLIVPATAVIVSVLDFLISFGLLSLLMLWFNFTPNWRIVTIPAWLLLAFMASFGASLLIAALTVRYRDFRHVTPFIIQLGLYASPVGFSSTVVPAQWKFLYFINPAAGIIEGFRWAIIGPTNDPFFLIGVSESIGVSLFLLWVGVRYFRGTERLFADYI